MSGFSWGEVFVMAISGGLVAWIPFGITQWQSHRTLKAHIDEVTAAQTGTITGLTESQTAVIASLTEDQTVQLTGELLAARSAKRAAGPPQRYHGHEGDEGADPGS